MTWVQARNLVVNLLGVVIAVSIYASIWLCRVSLAERLFWTAAWSLVVAMVIAESDDAA